MADATVKLEITNTNPNSTAWKNAVNSQGQSLNYWYQFSEGNANDPNNPGGFKFSHGGGVKNIDIKLKNSSGYKITNVGVTYNLVGGNNPPADISIPANQQSDNKWTITDSDVDAESGYFNVTVATTGSPPVTGIICDPFWENE